MVLCPTTCARGHTDLPVSPLHDVDHGFRVLQTTGYSVRSYPVRSTPPPAHSPLYSKALH